MGRKIVIIMITLIVLISIACSSSDEKSSEPDDSDILKDDEVTDIETDSDSEESFSMEIKESLQNLLDDYVWFSEGAGVKIAIYDGNEMFESASGYADIEKKIEMKDTPPAAQPIANPEISNCSIFPFICA